jgi:hypothetical protein
VACLDGVVVPEALGKRGVSQHTSAVVIEALHLPPDACSIEHRRYMTAVRSQMREVVQKGGMEAEASEAFLARHAVAHQLVHE